MNSSSSERNRLSERAQRVGESITLAIPATAKKMRAAGIDVVSLSIGEPDFPTPDVIKEAAFEAIRKNITKYDHAAGMVELREVIAEKLTRENNIPATVDEVVVTNGGKQALENAMLAVLDPGDEVLLPCPYWSSYPDIIRIADGTPVLLNTTAQTRYKITPDQLRAALTPRSRAIILNSPSNPSGVMYSPEELQAIGHVAAEAGLYVVSDELYEKIIYGNNTHFSIGAMPELRDLAITVNGASKAYSMTGWRLGYMHAPLDVAQAAYRLQSQMTSHPSTISQYAVITALTKAAEESHRMVEAFTERRSVIMRELECIPDITYPNPDGAFYIFIDVSAYLDPDAMPDSYALAAYLLREYHVAVIPGNAFGAPEAIRLSYACSQEDICKGVSRLAAGLEAVRTLRITS